MDRENETAPMAETPSEENMSASAETETETPADTDNTAADGTRETAGAEPLGEEQTRLFEELVRGNGRLRAQRDEQLRREAAAERALAWQREAESLRSVYPGLELAGELASPRTGGRFKQLLLGGADVRTAYEAVHRDEILAAVMRFAAERAREMTVSDIRARGTRPAENGVDGTAATALGRVNVHDLTRRERESIARRVLNGERVEL